MFLYWKAILALARTRNSSEILAAARSSVVSVENSTDYQVSLGATRTEQHTRLSPSVICVMVQHVVGRLLTEALLATNKVNAPISHRNAVLSRLERKLQDGNRMVVTLTDGAASTWSGGEVITVFIFKSQ